MACYPAYVHTHVYDTVHSGPWLIGNMASLSSRLPDQFHPKKHSDFQSVNLAPRKKRGPSEQNGVKVPMVAL